MTRDQIKKFARFENRLDRLLQDAAGDSLCCSCVCKKLFASAIAVAQEADNDALKAHGLVALITPPTITTRH